MPKTAARRTLAFSSLDQVMPDVDRLMAEGYTTCGAWGLGQICKHLTGAVVGSIDGYHVAKAPWLIRRLVAPIVLKRTLKSGVIPEGVKTATEFVPTPGLDDRAEVEALRAAIQLFSAHTGPFAEHPFFGWLDRDSWTRLHQTHIAHHLSFVLPKAKV